MVELSPEKLSTPTSPYVIESDSEIRFELPFDAHSGNLFYVGVNFLKNWTTPFHFHEHFELCYLADGEGLYHIDKSLYHLKPCQLFVTRPGESHYGLAGNESKFRLYYMGFKLDNLRGLESEYYNLGSNRILEDRGGQVKSLFDLIVNEIRNRQIGSMHMVNGLFIQLIVTVLRLYHERSLLPHDKPALLSSHIIKLMNLLHEEIRYDHKIDDISKKIHLSRSHLAREFKLATGITIGEYIRALCLDKAKYQLRETELSVTAIADELHFKSIYSFSIFFKNQTGLSPMEYRKRSIGQSK